MKWIKKIFGRKSEIDVEGVDERVDSSSEIDPEMQEMLEKGVEARELVLASLGDLDSDVIAPFVNPAFMGGPAWPSLRQSWRVIRKPGSTIVVSDGLSDPFEDEKVPLGYRVEVCAEAPETYPDIRSSWLFGIVYQVSQLVAHHGNVHEMLENKYNTLSTVVSVDGLPEEWKNEDGKVGVLLGFPNKNFPSHIQLPEGSVRILVIKLLHPRELRFIEADEDMEKQRNILVAAFKGNHLSEVDREPVV
ncbi:hypothetical protein [Modicisalibacter coralii]|uniref:hypothetical protein n=1 Tax=Modicisalibacter coralii TaxID=2304602 RepID=UPI00100B3D5E|nr:hypothetical protein [Halomonas coralii]